MVAEYERVLGAAKVLSNFLTEVSPFLRRIATFSPHLRYPAEIVGTKNALHLLYHNIKYLGCFLCCATFPFVIGYKHNLLISITKGATGHVYFTQYPYPTSERILVHHPRQTTESLVRLCPAGIHRPFYQFDLFKHPSLFEHSLRPEREQTSALTGIDPHLLMRVDPPELCSGFDPSLIFSI